MERNENTCHCNAWRGRGGDLGRELLHCTFLLEKYLKVFVNKYSQSPEGGGKPQGVGGMGIKGESIDCFSYLMNRSRGNGIASL
jgi:hypothetical protein